MDFADRIRAHAARVGELKSHAASEEATKMSLIVPFLNALGYDSFDPRVVVPEFCADVGTKKGEKVDYAIKRGDEIIMLIEAKKVGDPLDAGKATQLHRYFHGIPSAKIAILTDGVVYKFFTDLDQPNIMDDRPFMTFDFDAVEDPLVVELKKLCNDCFDVDIALSAAQELKYLGQIKKIIAREMKKPEDELVKYFAKQVYAKPLFANVLDTFREHVRMAFEHCVNDTINTRLQGAMLPNAYPIKPSSEAVGPEEAGDDTSSKDDRIVTTEEELEGYMIVKAILREVVDVDRVAMRDTISYCGVLLDDNNRKPLCRMHFNSDKVKYFETVDAEKKGTKHKIESLNDIYKFADELKASVAYYN